MRIGQILRTLLLLGVLLACCLVAQGSVIIHKPFNTYPSCTCSDCDLVCETFECSSGGAGESYAWDTYATATQVADAGAGGSSTKAAQITNLSVNNFWLTDHGDQTEIYFHLFANLYSVPTPWDHAKDCCFYKVLTSDGTMVLALEYYWDSSNWRIYTVYYDDALQFDNSYIISTNIWYEFWGHYKTGGGANWMNIFVRPVGGATTLIRDDDNLSSARTPHIEKFGVVSSAVPQTDTVMRLDRISSSASADCTVEN